MRPGVRVGIDVGSVRVGVATCDPDGLIATPVATVREVLEVAAIVAELGAMEVVVGLPRSLSGEEGPAAEAARTYADVLAARVAPVGVRLFDERLTTVDAHRTLRESGVAGRRQRVVVDQVAAVLILQAALDTERGTGHPPGEPVRHGRRKPRTRDGMR
jgi:putative Holliday junction resolvase